MDAYQKLHQLSRYCKTLQGVSSLLGWDQETYMPPGGGQNRSEQLKVMAGLIHRNRTSKEYVKALGELVDLETGTIKVNDLAFEKQAALKEWYRDYKHDTALPHQFVEDFAELTSQAQLVWRKAKEHNVFQQYAPFLDKIVSMSRQKAEYLGYSEHPYDALLNLYEHDLTTKQVGTLFQHLKTSILPLLNKIKQKKQVDDHFLHGSFSIPKQMAFCKKMLNDIGYDMNKGRLDFSTHPFSCASHPTDSRITTRVDPGFILSNISVVLHEAGHSFYEMGLPVEEFGTPLGEAISLGMHESQSRWWETRIGHSEAFWRFYFPKLKKLFKGKFDDVSVPDFYKAINKVNPSFIRVEADEVTYSLHVILRFELEKALIEGSLTVRDIPEAWNTGMQELLGITPNNYSEGCLQDVHWSMGAFGYFPGYTLGNLYASQFFNAFAEEHPDWEKQITDGNFQFILSWLRTHIHRHGRCFNSMDLVRNVTGKSFSSEAFIQYLTNKYSNIYI